MAQYYPVIKPAGASVVGESIGFHAYSLRVDNCTNQWYFEESSIAFIPPYSLGMCLRLYGTGVAILLAQAPVGQLQLAPIVGEQVVGVYSDQLRTEVAASPIRQFTLVQAVSDLTEGPQPALPPVGVDRLYADASGNIHHLHSDGTDLTLVDPSNAGTLLFPSFDPHYQAMVNATPLGADLFGTVSAGHVSVQPASRLNIASATPITWNNDANHKIDDDTTNNVMHFDEYGTWQWRSSSHALAVVMSLDGNGNLTLPTSVNAGGGTIAGGGAFRVRNTQQAVGVRNSANNGDDYLGFDGSDTFAITGRAPVGVGGSSVADMVITINGTQYRINLKQ